MEQIFPTESRSGDSHLTEYEGRQYDVYKLITCSELLPVIEVPLGQLETTLQDLCWSDQGENSTIGPNIIIKALKQAENWDKLYQLYPELAKHAKKVQFADYSYPILLTPEGRVIDGVHRLTKAFIDGVETIKAKMFDRIPEEAVVEETK